MKRTNVRSAPLRLKTLTLVLCSACHSSSLDTGCVLFFVAYFDFFFERWRKRSHLLYFWVVIEKCVFISVVPQFWSWSEICKKKIRPCQTILSCSKVQLTFVIGIELKMRLIQSEKLGGEKHKLQAFMALAIALTKWIKDLRYCH